MASESLILTAPTGELDPTGAAAAISDALSDYTHFREVLRDHTTAGPSDGTPAHDQLLLARWMGEECPWITGPDQPTDEEWAQIRSRVELRMEEAILELVELFRDQPDLSDDGFSPARRWIVPAVSAPSVAVERLEAIGAARALGISRQWRVSAGDAETLPA